MKSRSAARPTGAHFPATAASPGAPPPGARGRFSVASGFTESLASPAPSPYLTLVVVALTLGLVIVGTTTHVAMDGPGAYEDGGEGWFVALFGGSGDHVVVRKGPPVDAVLIDQQQGAGLPKPSGPLAAADAGPTSLVFSANRNHLNSDARNRLVLGRLERLGDGHGDRHLPDAGAVHDHRVPFADRLLRAGQAKDASSSSSSSSRRELLDRIGVEGIRQQGAGDSAASAASTGAPATGAAGPEVAETARPTFPKSEPHVPTPRHFDFRRSGDGRLALLSPFTHPWAYGLRASTGEDDIDFVDREGYLAHEINEARRRANAHLPQGAGKREPLKSGNYNHHHNERVPDPDLDIAFPAGHHDANNRVLEAPANKLYKYMGGGAMGGNDDAEMQHLGNLGVFEPVAPETHFDAAVGRQPSAGPATGLDRAAAQRAALRKGFLKWTAPAPAAGTGRRLHQVGDGDLLQRHPVGDNANLLPPAGASDDGDQGFQAQLEALQGRYLRDGVDSAVLARFDAASRKRLAGEDAAEAAAAATPKATSRVNPYAAARIGEQPPAGGGAHEDPRRFRTGDGLLEHDKQRHNPLQHVKPPGDKGAAAGEWLVEAAHKPHLVEQVAEVYRRYYDAGDMLANYAKVLRNQRAVLQTLMAKESDAGADVPRPGSAESEDDADGHVHNFIGVNTASEVRPIASFADRVDAGEPVPLAAVRSREHPIPLRMYWVGPRGGKPMDRRRR